MRDCREYDEIKITKRKRKERKERRGEERRGEERRGVPVLKTQRWLIEFAFGSSKYACVSSTWTRLVCKGRPAMQHPNMIVEDVVVVVVVSGM
jgi:hypothetical protein